MEAIPEPNQLVSDQNTEETRIRRPPNAFMIFGKKYRKVLAKKFDKLSNKQISKILGNEWKNMDPTTKSQYHTLAKETYQTHLEKYPNYHYNPLEARQRKAERKRKYKTSRITHKARAGGSLIVPVIKPFGGNRSIAFPNTTFGFQTPTVQFIQPINRSGTGDSVIGIKRLNHSLLNEETPPEVTAIEHKEHNYSFQPKMDQTFAEDNHFGDDWQHINQIEVQTQQIESQIDWNQSFDFLVNFLPPMLNPNAEVTAVPLEFGQNSNEDSNHQIDGQTTEEENKEELFDENNNTLIGERIDFTDFIKTEIKSEPFDQQFDQLFKKELKVVVKRIPQ